MSHELAAAIRALPESVWQPERADAHAGRHWAEAPYVPGDGVSAKDRPEPPRYLTLRITKKQGELFDDGGAAKHFAMVTNLPDPPDGSGLDLIRWQRGKAGTVEHSHHVLTDELAAAALPSQKFGANRGVVPAQRHALQPALGVQASGVARGAARRATQAAALHPAQRCRQGRAPRP